MRPVAIDFTHDTDREGLLALLMSTSVVASLPEEARVVARERLAEILARHGVGALKLGYVATLRLAERSD